MTKLQKVNEFTGMLEDVYPNLIIVGGKNLAVPVDKQHLVKNMDAKVGDIIRITYDERGYLQGAELKERGVPLEKKPLPEQEVKLIPKPAEPIKEYVSLRDSLILKEVVFKALVDLRIETFNPEKDTYDSCCEDVMRNFEMMIPRLLK